MSEGLPHHPHISGGVHSEPLATYPSPTLISHASKIEKSTEALCSREPSSYRTRAERSYFPAYQIAKLELGPIVTSSSSPYLLPLPCILRPSSKLNPTLRTKLEPPVEANRQAPKAPRHHPHSSPSSAFSFPFPLKRPARLLFPEATLRAARW